MKPLRTLFACATFVWLAPTIPATTDPSCGFSDSEETQDSSQGSTDLFLEQKYESASMNGNMVLKIRGDIMRCDYPENLGDVSALLNLKSGDYHVLMHTQKMVMKMSLAAQKKQVEQQQKAAGIDPAKIEKPKATGKKEKVGPWEAEIFETQVGKEKVRCWVVKDFPNYRSVQGRMRKFHAAGGSFDPNSYDLGGLLVKYEMNVPPGGQSTVTLLRFREERLKDSDFKLPADYRLQDMGGACAE